jgi:hypothetical protein
MHCSESQLAAEDVQPEKITPLAKAVAKMNEVSFLFNCFIIYPFIIWYYKKIVINSMLNSLK